MLGTLADGLDGELGVGILLGILELDEPKELWEEDGCELGTVEDDGIGVEERDGSVVGARLLGELDVLEGELEEDESTDDGGFVLGELEGLSDDFTVAEVVLDGGPLELLRDGVDLSLLEELVLEVDDSLVGGTELLDDNNWVLGEVFEEPEVVDTVDVVDVIDVFRDGGQVSEG